MTAVHYLIVIGIFFATICRARHMDGDTRTMLKVQYGLLLSGSVLSLPIYGLGETGQVLLCICVLLYLWLDARRWKRGVPR